MNRKIDYYLRGLNLEERQNIWQALDNINPNTIRNLLEEKLGYPSLKGMYFSEEDIREYINRAVSKFIAANNLMIKYHRYPIFSDPYNTYQSSQEYSDVMQQRTEEELLKIFGCIWDEYIPKEYIKSQSNKKDDKDVPS